MLSGNADWFLDGKLGNQRREGKRTENQIMNFTNCFFLRGSRKITVDFPLKNELN